MKFKELFEAPLTSREEKKFLSQVSDYSKEYEEWPRPDKVQKMLKKISPKSKKIGSGSFSDVYGKDRGKSVVKMSKSDDACALLYLQWAQKQKDDPHVPRIYKLQSMGDSVYARMEPLKPLHALNYPWNQQHLSLLVYFNEFDLAVMALGYKTKNDIPEKYRYDNSIPSSLLRHPAEWEDLSVAYQQQILKLAKSQNKTNSFIQTYEKIRKLDLSRCFMDFEIRDGHNIMVRPSTNELVFADPIGPRM